MRSALILLLLTNSLRAQPATEDSTRHIRLTLGVGAGSIASFDNLGSPVPYKAAITPIFGSIEYLTHRAQHILEGNGMVAGINASRMTPYRGGESEYQIPFLYYSVNYLYLQSLPYILNSPLHMSVGGECSNFYFYRDYTGSNFGFEGASSLGPVASFGYTLNERHQVRALVEIPLVSLLVRPPYDFVNGNLSNLSDVHVRVIGQMFAADFAIGYDYAVSRQFTVDARYQLKYYHYPLFYWTTDAALSDISMQIAWRFDL